VTSVLGKTGSRRQFSRWLGVAVWSVAVVLSPATAVAQQAPQAKPAVAADKQGDEAAENDQDKAELKLELNTVIVGGVILGVVSLLWAGTSWWIVGDARRQGMGSKKWKKIIVFPYAFLMVVLLAAVGLNWTEYAFLEAGGLWLGLGVLAADWLLPLVVYFIARTRALNDTGEVVAKLPEIELVATCREVPEENTLLVEKVTENPLSKELVKILAEGVAARVPTILLDDTSGGLHVRHEVDGVKQPVRVCEGGLSKRSKKGGQPEVWADAPPLDPTTGAEVLTMLLRLAGLSPKKRGRPQEGSFAITVDGKQRGCRLATKMTKAGEQFALELETPPAKFKSAEDLGMPSEMLERLRRLVNLKRGLVLVSAAPGHGLSTCFDMVVTAADRLMRDFVSIEEAGEQAAEVQNVKVQKYDAGAGETPVTAVEKAALSYPSGFVTRRLADPELAADLVGRALEDKLVIVSLPADDSIDAIGKLLELGIKPSDLARCFLGSVSQRLVRKLCPKCAEEQEPPLPLLEKFGKTAEDVPHIKNVSEHGGCRFCSGRGFLGRTGAFEMATGTPLRKEIARRAEPAELRKAAGEDNFRGMREYGMELVLAGVSSLDEMQRVFTSKKKNRTPSPRRSG